MPFVSVRDYETVTQVETLVTSGRRKRIAKVLAGLALGLALGIVAAAAARPRPGLTPLDRSDVVVEFTATQFPQDCNKMMQYVGCKKKAWACEEDDGTTAYKCCCDNSIWQVPIAPLPARALVEGDSILRLQNTADVCLGAEESAGSFSFAPCGKANTRFQLPPRGAGPIKLASNPSMCLGVTGGDVRVAGCNGGQDQVFQLTKGTQGMLQWSQTGTRCLDSEDASMQKGSKVILQDCNFWPVKPSQVFVLEQAPQIAEDDAGGRTHPSLFCTSLMLPWSYEVGMLKSHLAHGSVGIFGCDDWAVYSNKRVQLREASDGQEELFCDVMNGTLRAKIGGKFHTALNTPIFRRFWARIVEDPRSWKNDWIVKLDPDAVFFADRLKEMLRSRWPGGVAPGAAWLNNCQLGLHGPIEVFNQKALSVYKEKSDDCTEVAKRHRQEDVYLAHCFAALGVERVDAFNLLLESEWACNERPSSRDNRPPCFDQQVSFHPFKSVTSYFNCYNRAKKMWWALPMRIVSEEPGPQNHHHA
mmetsp:Transcript_46478/g.107264  ORF Transcript_46478/g.107264 Transcript_46478/m.107264 type:complete len:529 (+) Transcript_46478:56-1642(+)